MGFPEYVVRPMFATRTAWVKHSIVNIFSISIGVPSDQNLFTMRNGLQQSGVHVLDRTTQNQAVKTSFHFIGLTVKISFEHLVLHLRHDYTRLITTCFQCTQGAPLIVQRRGRWFLVSKRLLTSETEKKNW